MKRLIGLTLAMLALGVLSGAAAATPKVEPQSLAADLSYWGQNPNAPYPKLIFYEGGVPWLNWVGSPIYYQYTVAGCAQIVQVFVPTCVGCAPVCPPGGCSKAIVEGVARASGVYRVLRFDAGDEWWGSDPIPYDYDASTNILTLTLPNTCNGGG